MDSSLVVEAIEKLNQETRVKNPSFATSLSGHSVIIKKIELPTMSHEELADSIQWEAEQYIPFDINDVRMDYVVLSEEGTAADQMEVLLVAVKRDKVNDYVSVISQAGKHAGTGRRRRLRHPERVRAQLRRGFRRDRVIALVNMGAGVTTHQRARPAGRRSSGATSPSAAASSRRPCSGNSIFLSSRPRHLKRGREAAEGHNPRGRGAGSGRASRVEMAGELQKTFDFFADDRRAKATVDLRWSCREAARSRRACSEVLSDRLGAALIELMDPLRRSPVQARSDFDSGVAASRSRQCWRSRLAWRYGRLGD